MPVPSRLTAFTSHLGQMWAALETLSISLTLFLMNRPYRAPKRPALPTTLPFALDFDLFILYPLKALYYSPLILIYLIEDLYFTRAAGNAVDLVDELALHPCRNFNDTYPRPVILPFILFHHTPEL